MQSSISYGEPVNGCRPKLTHIGTVTTTEPREHRIGYETASWYTLVEVPAGTYDVVLCEERGMRWVLVRYAGTITDEHFVNRVFTASSVAPKRNIGEPRSCTSQLYPYIAAQAFASDPQWELAEDWSVTSREVELDGGRLYTSSALVAPDGTEAR